MPLSMAQGDDVGIHAALDSDVLARLHP